MAPLPLTAGSGPSASARVGGEVSDDHPANDTNQHTPQTAVSNPSPHVTPRHDHQQQQQQQQRYRQRYQHRKRLRYINHYLYNDTTTPRPLRTAIPIPSSTSTTSVGGGGGQHSLRVRQQRSLSPISQGEDWNLMRATTPQSGQRPLSSAGGRISGVGAGAERRRSSVSGSNGGNGGGSGTALRTSFGSGGTGTALRSSFGTGGRASGVGAGSVSGIPRAGGVSRLSAMRATTSQPSYDFITGGEPAPSTTGVSGIPTRGALRERVVSSENLRSSSINYNSEAKEKEDRELAELRAEVKTLKYTIHTNEQEKEVTTLRQESELRDVRRKAEEDFRKMQEAERERSKAVRMYEELVKELQGVKDGAVEEKAVLERRLREEMECRRGLEEEVGDVKAEAEEKNRGLERVVKEGEMKVQTLQGRVDELLKEGEERDEVLREVQQKLVQTETQVGELEGEVLRLKAQTGDVDTLGVIKRELSEQVAHIRTLEATNREQTAELKHFRRLHKGVEVVEEEKRALQRKVDSIADLEQELGEARLQRQILEDERLAWTSYLKSQAGEDGQMEFDSPEAVARALVQERVENASLLEKLGNLEPAIGERDVIIKSLEDEKKKLESQVDKLRSGDGDGSGGDQKARLRLERNRTLALREVDYLRAQLKALDSEESTMELASYDEAKAKRIVELEDLVTQYSTEVQTLHAELAAAQSNAPSAATDSAKNKRPRDEDSEDNEQLGQLARKNRKLQDDLSAAQKAVKLAYKELAATREQLTALQQHSKTRILSLRQNPTAEVEAIKMTTLTTLRAENADLLQQLRNPSSKTTRAAKEIETIPLSTLKAKELELTEKERELASAKKSMTRLKQVWGAKTAEFREGVRSLLGWKVDFLPSGKLRVGSLFLPGSESDSDGDENTIVFDGEKGTMKVSGGPRSEFARKIGDQIKFWVEERGEIPCLLAALTLEFYEESTRAARV